MKASTRTRVRLLLRDLSAGFAFGAMAISGELPVWSVALFLVGWVIALFGIRPLARIGVVSGVLVAAGAAGLYANVAGGGSDLVVAACAFAAIISLHRMLSAPVPRTDHQVLLTSLLMISGGAALSGELLFAVMLFLFSIFACLSLALGVVERAVPPGADFDTQPVLRRMGAGVAVAMLGAALCFVFIPRVSWNALGRRPSKGLGGTTGLGDGVRLGGSGGSIKTNPRIVARIHLKPDPGDDQLNAHWIASTYADFDGSAWTGSGPRKDGRWTVTLDDAVVTESIHQEIETLPAYGGHVAFAMADPVTIGQAIAHSGNTHARTRMIEIPGVELRFAEDAPAYTFHAYSAVGPRERVTDRLDPRDQLRLTRLPAQLDPRIAALAAQVVEGEKDPVAAAHKLERYLKANYRYTLELPDSPKDPLADFLFDRKEGHCEYFASALAVLLRTQGFAARVATGFYGGERISDEYVLRAGDAHAWTQVFEPGVGFVNVDATPDAGRLAQASALFGWLTSVYERLDTRWRSSVLDYSLQDQYGMAFKVLDASKGRSRLKLPRSGTWLFAATIALLAYALWRLRQVVRTKEAPAHPATKLRDAAEALLAKRGITARDGEGFEDLTARLANEQPAAGAALTPLCARYVESRFSNRPLSQSEAKRLLDSLQAALARDIPARPLPRARHG